MSKKKFFKRMRNLGLALTFDDVILKTGYSEVMPNDVALKTKFSRNVPLNIPIVSAAMDTLTEYRLAIELAKLGGLGIIHRNLTPEEQADQVQRVKFHLNGLNGLIENPISVYDDQTIEEVLHKKEDKRYSFDSFPVLNREGRLVGIITGNDFDFCNANSLTVRQVMTSEPLTAEVGITLDQAYTTMTEHKKKVLPLVDANGGICGLYVWKDVNAIKSGKSVGYNIDPRGQLRVGAAIGVGEDALGRLDKLIKKGVDVVVIDTAHADSNPVYQFINTSIRQEPPSQSIGEILETAEEIRRRHLNIDIVVGNISEPKSAKRLLETGAVDGIKIGQGPGSICTTRIIAGIGCPQITAIYNCARIADFYEVPVCGDGGLQYSGDISKAIGAGAHSVMLGNMLAGTEEAPGDTVFVEGRQWKRYRGMGSMGAMMEHKGSRERYYQGGEGRHSLVPQGVEALVPFKGGLAEVISQYLGGLRSGMGYVGAATIAELREKADFRRVDSGGQRESHPHNVYITAESPNYPGRL